MDINKNYYGTLGVSKDADLESIKKSYRKLSFQYHPDKNPDNKEAEEKFKLLSEAYAVISDPKQKDEYDKRSRYGNAYDENYERFHTGRGFDPFSVFNNAEAIFEKMRKEEALMRELAVVVDVTITMADVYMNRTIEKKYQRRTMCQGCNGFGFNAANPEHLYDCEFCQGSGKDRAGKKACHQCHGYGQISDQKCEKCQSKRFVEQEETISLDNVANFLGRSQTLQQPGAGHYSIDQEHVGPLVVNLHFEQPEDVGVQNSDIYRTLNVHYQDAIDGTAIDYQHYDGKTYQLKLPKGSNNNSKVRMVGKGMLKRNRYNNTYSTDRGDLYLVINVCIDYDRLKETTTHEQH